MSDTNPKVTCPKCNYSFIPTDNPDINLFSDKSNSTLSDKSISSSDSGSSSDSVSSSDISENDSFITNTTHSNNSNIRGSKGNCINILKSSEKSVLEDRSHSRSYSRSKIIDNLQTYIKKNPNDTFMNNCLKWERLKQSDNIQIDNPFTGKSINEICCKNNKETTCRVWNDNDNFCEKVQDNIVNLQTEPDKINIKFPDDINTLFNNIKGIATRYWKSDKLNLSEICGYYDKNNTSGDIVIKEQTFNYLYKKKDISDKRSEILTTTEKEEYYNRTIKKRVKLPKSQDKKFIQEIVTEFNSLYMLSNANSRLTFIKLIIESYQVFLKEIFTQRNEEKIKNPELPELNSHNLNILFKGGTAVRFIINEMTRDFTKDIENMLLNDTKNYTKLSDFDFEIISVKGLLDNNTLVKLNILCYIVLLLIREYLVKHQLFFFDIFKYKRIEHEKIVKRLLKKIQNKIDSVEIDNYYNNVRLDYIEYGNVELYNNEKENKSFSDWPQCTDNRYKLFASRDLKDDEVKVPNIEKYRTIDNITKNKNYIDQKYNSSCKTDFAIVPDISSYNMKNDSNDRINIIPSNILLKKYGFNDPLVNSLTTRNKEKGDRFYVSHNPIIQIISEKTRYKQLFCLNRIKYNYILYYTKDHIHYKDSISSEIVDISHSFNEDCNKLTKAIENDLIKSYSFYRYNFKFISYTISGLVKDLYFILFYETNFRPWIDSKYHKRLGRLCYLVIFNYLTIENSRSYSKKVKLIEKLTNLIDVDFYNTKNFKDDILNNLRENLYKVSLEKNLCPEKYQEYKTYIITKFKHITEVLTREGFQLKNFNLHRINNINANQLNIQYLK